LKTDFQGKEGQTVPFMSEDFVAPLFLTAILNFMRNITGDKFQKSDISEIQSRIENAVNEFLKGKV
jgi:phosphoribosylaminoimidazole-succinocarboxamide synthase